jgi:bleomycin hydrolase
MKRKAQESIDNFDNKKFKFTIDDNFIETCETEFNKSDMNRMVKNIITNVGSFHASTDNNEARNVSHVFLSSVKKKNIKATNQGASGRCWIFSGLNVFRHNIIKALDLENFEFSETYLFFWDKFERSNCFLQWVNEIVYKEKDVDNSDKLFNYLIESENWMSDGGYWGFFANLVEKYGFVPKSAMPESFQSEYSDDMNNVIIDILHSCSIRLSKLRKSSDIRKQIVNETLKQVYNTLVKFLGEPPKTFNWDFTNELEEPVKIVNMNPISFADTIIPGLKLQDFILLSNIPSKNFKYYKKYQIKYTNNVIEKSECSFINLPINELKKYAKKSILAGMPVWFAGDVGKGFNPVYSALNNKINNTELLFGKTKMDKEERILFSNQKTSHAMTIVGVNYDKNDKTTSWQVENSWGFYDNEIPGLDGFLCMDDKWFDEYLGQVVIHKNFLSRTILNIIESEPVMINPWDSVAPALKVSS